MISYELFKKIHKQITIGHRALQKALVIKRYKINTNDLSKRENITEVFDIENENYKDNDFTIYVFMDKQGWLEVFLGNKPLSTILNAKRGKNIRKYIVENNICRVFKTIKCVRSFVEPRQDSSDSAYIRYSHIHHNSYKQDLRNADTEEKRNEVYLKISKDKRERREYERYTKYRDIRYGLYHRLEKYKQGKVENVSDENIRLKMSAFFSLYANCVAQNDYTTIRDNFGKYISSFDNEFDWCRKTVERFNEYTKYPNDLQNKVKLIEMLQIEH